MKRIALVALCALLLMAVVPALAQAQDVTVHATAQVFEGGIMIWRSDTSFIWVLINNGQAYSFPASSYATLPDNPIFGTPPSRLRPIHGFGKIWGNYSSIREQLGWPVQPEIGFNMRIIFNNGVYYLRQLDGTVYQINPNGTWNLAPGFPAPVPTFTPLPPPGNAFIASFDVQPASSTRGGAINLSWAIYGAPEALIDVYDMGSNRLVDTFAGLPAFGSTTYIIPESVVGDVRFVLAGVQRVFSTSLVATYHRLVESAFVVRVDTTPDHSVVTYAAYQPYEGGFMIWRSDTGGIVVFFGSGNSGTYAFYPVTLYGPLPDNPIFNPPSGRVRPINGFGRVWGNYEFVRAALGWATAPEQGYQTTITLAQGLPVAFTLPDGRTVNLNFSGGWSIS